MAKRRRKSKSYDKFLLKQLRDPELAAAYLSGAVKEKSLELLLIALKNVAEAHGGIGILSNITNLNRQSMYKMFSESGNPKLSSLLTVLDALGIDLSFTPQGTKQKKVA